MSRLTLGQRVRAFSALIVAVFMFGLMAPNAEASTQWSGWVPCVFSGAYGQPGSSYTFVRWMLSFSGGYRRVSTFQFGNGATEHITSVSISQTRNGIPDGTGMVTNYSYPGPYSDALYPGTRQLIWEDVNTPMKFNWHLARSGAPNAQTAECSGQHDM